MEMWKFVAWKIVGLKVVRETLSAVEERIESALQEAVVGKVV
jgi:hypothetical protein